MIKTLFDKKLSEKTTQMCGSNTHYGHDKSNGGI